MCERFPFLFSLTSPPPLPPSLSPSPPPLLPVSHSPPSFPINKQLIIPLNSSTGTPTYHHFEKIFNFLKEDNNNNQTDFFGRYVSTIMSSLNGILNGFKASNLYLVDTASNMAKIIQFDVFVPFFSFISVHPSFFSCPFFFFFFFTQLSSLLHSPAVKRELSRVGKQITDLKRKEADCERNANKYSREFQDSCQKWGIEVLFSLLQTISSSSCKLFFFF